MRITSASESSENVGGRLRIGYLSTMYHSSLLIKGMKLLEGKGLEPSWFLFGTGPSIVEALAKGQVDIGYIGLAPTAIGIGKGVKIKCIAGGHVEGTVIVARRNYKTATEYSGKMSETLAQFKGKKIGVPRRGSLHDVFLRHYLSQSGLEDSVEVVNYDWADFIPDAMSKGDVDAACGTPPLAVLLSQLLGAKIIIPPSMIWPNNPSYGIIASTKMLGSSPEILETFLRIHKDICCRMLSQDRRRAAESVAKIVGLVNEDFVLKTFQVSPKYCAALSKEFIESTVTLLSVLVNLGYLSSDIRGEDIFETELIKKVHPESSHYDRQEVAQ